MLAPGFVAPPYLDYSGYQQYIEDKLPPESPALYGLHPNAEIEFLTVTSNTLFRTLLEMQPRNAVSSEELGQSTEDKVRSFLFQSLEWSVLANLRYWSLLSLPIQSDNYHQDRGVGHFSCPGYSYSILLPEGNQYPDLHLYILTSFELQTHGLLGYLLPGSFDVTVNLWDFLFVQWSLAPSCCILYHRNIQCLLHHGGCLSSLWFGVIVMAITAVTILTQSSVKRWLPGLWYHRWVQCLATQFQVFPLTGSLPVSSPAASFRVC